MWESDQVIVLKASENVTFESSLSIKSCRFQNMPVRILFSRSIISKSWRQNMCRLRVIEREAYPSHFAQFLDCFGIV